MVSVYPVLVSLQTASSTRRFPCRLWDLVIHIMIVDDVLRGNHLTQIYLKMAVTMEIGMLVKETD